jgi:hypothetical protein
VGEGGITLNRRVSHSGTTPKEVLKADPNYFFGMISTAEEIISHKK